MTPARSPRILSSPAPAPGLERAEIERDLLARQASVAAKYFYDRLGSVLFDAITELPEYYPTRTEAAIFRTHGAAMADRVGAGATLVDLGAGNCMKAAGLFALLEPSRYVAVDISVAYLHDALKRLQREHPQLEIVGVGQDFSARLELPVELLSGRRCVLFYPGSSIGNFTPHQAREFLQGARAQAHGGGLLIGVDLVKDAAVLQAAYDDPLGVTAAFNLNVLRQVNERIGADFRLQDWRHVALYDADRSRVEMHLQARRAVVVHWRSGERSFAAGERILTEISCKYTLEGFTALLEQAGFARPSAWTDERGWFAVFWAPSA
jgi:dimethylhistidine N-methyltransferase